MSFSSDSTVYGYIKDFVEPAPEADRRTVNMSAMKQLPSGELNPLLSQDMFSLPKTTFCEDEVSTELTHFGASYDGIEYEWPSWIANFEGLLKNMYWVSAVVHLETELSGTHTFVWQSQDDGHVPGASMSNTQVEWSHENSTLL